MRSFIFVISITFLSSGLIMADIIHVPGQYPTIQQGIDAAVAGDIVMVAPGHYPEEISLKADVIVLGAGEGLSIIDGGGDAGDVVSAIGNNINNNTKFKGFTVTGAISGGSMPGGGGIFCNSGASPEIANNRFEGNDQGIATWNNAQAFIHNNVVINNNYSGIDLSTNATIINNTIANNRFGIYDGGGYGPTVMNNIVTGNSRYGIYAVGTPPVLTYNDVWANDTNYRNCSGGTGSITENPMYQDTLTGNYHLQIGSPCIDARNPLPAYNDPDGTRNDMGGYGGPGAAIDIPKVVLTAPAQNELNTPCSTNVSAVFNLAMDSASFSPSSFRLNGFISGPHSGLISYDTTAKTVTINPGANFRPGELITSVLTKSIQSITGDSIDGFAWQFTTKVSKGSGRYSNPTAYSAGSAPTYIVTGDFNSDGNLDLAVTDQLSNRVAILFGNGMGEFVFDADYQVGSVPQELITADFNNDCILDLAVANSGSDNVSILLGNGDGTFHTALNFPAGDYPDAINYGDFNLDGKIDLAITNYYSENISILLGNGDGSFNPALNYAVGSGPDAIGIGDFNGDGFYDLGVANDNSNISILLGNSDGTFETAVNYAVGAYPASLCPGDFNQDGNLDFAVANSGSDNVSILLGDGNGGFGAAGNYSVGHVPSSILTSDLDGDGSLDLTIVNSQSHNVSILIGNGNGTFRSRADYPSGDYPGSVCAGDFDNDEDIDLSVINFGADAVLILLNEDALTVITTNPEQNKLAVPKSTNVSASFNMGVNPSTLNDTTIIVYGAKSGYRSGSMIYDSITHTVTFDPSADFYDGELVTTLLTKAIQAGSGVNLRGFAWNFSVGVTTTSNGTFNNRQDYSAGTEPRGMCAADFDNDRDIDLAVSLSNYPSPGQIAILLNNGNGTFAAPVYYTVMQDPMAVFAVDLDMDGDIDLAVAHNEPGSSHLVILKNNGSAVFSQFATYAPAILGIDVSGGDLDADGDIDLVMTDGWGSGSNVRIMFNNGTGSFSGPVTYSAGTWANCVMVRDVDNDGDMDIIVANGGNNNVSVLLNRSDGTFPVLANYPVGNSPDGIYGNDFNSDGYIDIATANSGSGNVTVILNNGDGTYSSPASYPTGTMTRFINGGDFDGDGDIDLAVIVNGSDSIIVLQNNGSGNFASALAYQVGTTPWGIDVADFDRDGDIDIACANYGTNNVTIWFNSGVGIVEASIRPKILTYLRVAPNPFYDRVNINYQINRPEDIKLKIYDASGRLVTSHKLPVTSHCFIWAGRDNSGRKVMPGVYFIHFEADNYNRIEKVVLLR
jgi:parallel beta-helix repeat protein